MRPASPWEGVGRETPEPLPDQPVLRVGNTLVLADLHIGKEEELRETGFNLPSQAAHMGEAVAALVEELRPERLVILGDLKHQFPRSTGLEKREVPRFFDRLQDHIQEAHLVPGNHDGNIDYLLPRWVTLHPPTGMRLGEVGLVHGHAWPAPEVMEAPTLLMGHNHPTILFRDHLGFRTIRRAWIRAPFAATSDRYPRLPEECIILPAFNPFSGGTTINETGSRLLGPLLQGLVRMEEAKVYLLDGVYLGPLKHMMVPGRGESLEEDVP